MRSFIIMNKMVLKQILGVAVVAFTLSNARAEVHLASPFTSHMVLQCDMKVPVWGTAEPGEAVTIEFAGQKKSAMVGADGRWRMELDPMKASAESRTFRVTGSKTATPVELGDVLVGEVWLASGQSNMEFSMS